MLILIFLMHDCVSLIFTLSFYIILQTISIYIFLNIMFFGTSDLKITHQLL